MPKDKKKKKKKNRIKNGEPRKIQDHLIDKQFPYLDINSQLSDNNSSEPKNLQIYGKDIEKIFCDINKETYDSGKKRIEELGKNKK